MDVFNVILGIIGSLLLLCVLIVAHELGHFLAGRACGIRIDEFAIGFGPKLFTTVKNDIRYSLRVFPMGGYVQFYGEDEEVDAAKEPRAFNNRPIWQRAVTFLAGPLMNFLFAVLVTVIVLTAFGDSVPFVAELQDGMPAKEAGLEVGDRILEVNGKRIDFFIELDAMEFQQDEVSFVVEREGKEFSYLIRPQVNEDGARVFGFSFGPGTVHFGFFESIALSFKWLFLNVKMMLVFLAKLIFKGQGAGDVAGPIGAVTIISQAFTLGFETVLRIAALLSINLGVVNLLPFPALDGGRIVFLGIEKVRKKPIPRNVEGYINFAGFVVLIGLMLLLTWQDIGRLIS